MIRKKKNLKPEKILEKEVLAHATWMGLDLQVIESKAVYSAKLKRYLRSHAQPGISDLVGCDMYGNACYVELKAKGKRSTIKGHQKSFLVSKIDKLCFAVCIDRIEQLEEYYDKYFELKSNNKNEELKQYLLSILP